MARLANRKASAAVGVGDHQVDAGAQPLRHLPAFPEGHVGCVLVAGEERFRLGDPRSLLVEPPHVGAGQRGQAVAPGVVVEAGEHLHVEHGARQGHTYGRGERLVGFRRRLGDWNDGRRDHRSGDPDGP